MTSIEDRFVRAGVEFTEQMRQWFVTVGPMPEEAVDAIIRVSRREWRGPSPEQFAALMERDARAKARFRRCMRRLEKRALAISSPFLADDFRDARLGAYPTEAPSAFDARAAQFRGAAPGNPKWLRKARVRRAFLCERAADAVARLRTETA